MRLLRFVVVPLFLGMLVVMAACSRSAQQEKLLTIKGSDTMVHLVSAWAEDWMQRNPGKFVSVTGGGTGTGVAALINKTTDMAAASRDIKPEEITLAEERGTKTQSVTVAEDAIAIIVNPKNPINQIDMGTLKKLFTGDMLSWTSLNGKPNPVMLYSRESSSGTYGFFLEHVLEKKDFSPKARLMPASSSLIEAVASDEHAIGYVGLGYVNEAKGRVKLLPVQKEKTATGVLPSEATIHNQTYPISRPLYLITPTAPKKLAQEFIAYCLSDAGQKMVEAQGYIPIEQP